MSEKFGVHKVNGGQHICNRVASVGSCVITGGSALVNLWAWRVIERAMLLEERKKAM